MITSFQNLLLDDKVLGNDLLELIIFCNALSEGRTCLIEDLLKKLTKIRSTINSFN